MKIKLQLYLKQQPIINSLIYVPLHLSILLYLFKQDSLPETLTEMNESFVIHTIYRHLSKTKGTLIGKVKKLTDLPEVVFNVIKQLSKLAFEGLLKNQLVFMKDDIKKVCPEIDSIPGAINGFDLLQTVQHYCQKGAAGTDMSFMFLHFTMQEFLAAFYVSTLQNDQQSLWIKRTFWNSHFNFMWMMYVGIVGVKSECVTKLIQSFGVNCEYNAQNNIKESLFLFQCYLEAKDGNKIPEVISSIFSDGNISFYGLTSLLPNHVTSLTYYMIKSHVKWKSINLRACNIRDDGVRILQQFFIYFQDKATSIKCICLSGNNLTSFFGSQTDVDHEQQKETETMVISTLYSFQLLDLSNNKISYNGLIELASVNVQKLDISHNMISDYEARAISEYLKKNSTICKLDVSGNVINKEGVILIFEAISVNTTLQKLNVADNKIPDDGTEAISSCLISNTTLLKLNISRNLISKEGVMRIVEACTKNRTLHKLVCTHNNLSKSGLAAINEYIRKENAVQIFDASWNSIASKDSKLALNINFQQINKSPADNTCKEIWSLSEFSFENDIYKRQLLHCCLEDPAGLAVSKVYLLDVVTNSVLLGMLDYLDISCNNISDEGTKRVAEAIQINTTLQKLNISKNLISKDGVMRIVEACTKNRTLHKLVCTHNNLSKSGLAAINEYIMKENAVQIFDASWNSIASKDNKLAIKTTFQLLNVQLNLIRKNIVLEKLWFIDEITELKYVKEFLHCCLDVQHVNLANITMTHFQMVTFCDCLRVNGTVTELSLFSNKIDDERAKRFAEAIQVNTTLQKLNLSDNKITDEGTKILAEAIQVNRTLQELNISNNKITDEGTKMLAEAIKENTTLQELNISKNWISKEGVMRILEACTRNRTLRKLVCTHNNLSKSGLAAINEYIRKENAVQIFDASWNSIGSKSGKLAVRTSFQLLDIQQGLQPDNDDIPEELWFFDEITEKRYRIKFLQICAKEHRSGHIFNLSAMGICNLVILNDYLKIDSELNLLSLPSNQITDEGAKIFAEANNINTVLQELNISKNWISNEGVMRIVEACTKNRTLHKLVCTHNNVSKFGLAAINEYIRKENALQIFDASWNSIIASSRCGSQLVITTVHSLRWSPDGWNSLDYDKQVWLIVNGVWNTIEYSIVHDSLIQLNFQSYNIQSDLWADIIQGVMQVNTLQKLNTSSNKISDDGAMAFSECLKTNTTLIELDMSWNNITHKGASAIAEAIQINIALQQLKISNNKISDDGAIAFSECLKTNATLIELDMSSNNITCKGASAIAEAMEINIVLRKLNISDNEISNDGAIAFSKCLKSNTTLIELDISGNNIICMQATEITEAIQVNSALQKLIYDYETR